MYIWSQTPPVHGGFFWVRATIDGIDHTSVVQVFLDEQYLGPKDFIVRPRLCALPLQGGNLFYLDSEEDVEGIQWQEVKPPEEESPSAHIDGQPV